MICVAANSFAFQRKTLLVLDSYYEGEPWSSDMEVPIAMHFANIDSVNCEIVNLENSLITDTLAFSKVCDNVFARYADRPPSYVVMIGSFAFNLRDRIRREWGDIPILLISQVPNLGRFQDYYTANQDYIQEDYGTPLSMVHGDYNFTAVIAPDYCRETVDLMVRMNPKMRELVFFSTSIFEMRRSAAIIAGHLSAKYPRIKFKWVRASERNAEVLQNYLANKHPESGLLVGTWMYERRNARGIPMLTTNELRLMASSKNPIFSLREAYRALGSLGGVYNDNEKIKEYALNVLSLMLEGKSMKDIPIVTADTKLKSVNYRLLREYDIPEQYCPEDMVFFNKPKTFWEKYMWQIIVAMLVSLILLVLMCWKVTSQRKRISELKYKEFFLNNMPIPYAQADLSFDKGGKVDHVVYTTMNEAFRLLLERNSRTDNPLGLFPPDFMAEKTSRLMKEGANVNFSYHFEKTDSHYDFIICSVGTKKKEDYKTINVVDVFARDVTARYRMENRIRQTAEKLDLSLRVSQLVPWQWYLEEGLISFDDRDVLGRTTSYRKPGEDEEWEIRFSDFLRRIHPDDVPQFLKLEDDLGKHLYTNYDMEVRMIANLESGEYDWAELTGAVTETDIDGGHIVTSGTLRIITEKKRQEEALRKALDKANESDRMKSAFLANMSHEIRTPLNAIVGFSNMIADSVEDERFDKFKEIINRNNALLLSLIGDVLDLAKIESNTIDLHKAPTDINELVTSAVQTVRFRVREGVTLRPVFGREACTAMTDSVRLSQILINLLTNACKFTSQGSITCGYEMRKGKLYFYVKDTGIGIPEEKLDDVFGQFVKLNSFEQGTGLGLAICKRLVELMGGEIGVKSEGKGLGSLFWFTLPYVQCQEA